MKAMKHRKAFTLIELMAVVAIIGILLGVVVSASANSIRLARRQKARAVLVCAQQGLETYKAQKDRWPGSFGNSVEGGSVPQRANRLGDNYSDDPEKFELNAGEIRDMIREIVMEQVRNNNPMMDISGLFVSAQQGLRGSRDYGLDFRDAVRGTKKSPKKMSVGQMSFGYPDGGGYFKHFWAVYSVGTDTLSLGEMPADSRRQSQP